LGLHHRTNVAPSRQEPTCVHSGKRLVRRRDFDRSLHRATRPRDDLSAMRSASGPDAHISPGSSTEHGEALRRKFERFEPRRCISASRSAYPGSEV
jgi:hypothetical protein